MHVPTVLYGYNIQTLRLPFMIQHSPTVGRSQQLRTTTTARVQYQGTAMKNTTTMGTSSQGTNLYLLGAMAE